MRNLKRVLSLALALVMMLGMMIITTSAAEATTKDFADADEIQYTEAADVLSALQVFEGDENSNFNPTKVLTREEAAAIICRMLMGPDNAKKLTGSAAFTDVAADRWSAGSIAYCANLGIIAGNGDGTFNPTGELTAVAFGKMLLTALGYDAEIEGYVNNANWATNIGADMLKIGIDVEGVALDAAVTREQAAQMAFQTLTKSLVDYTGGIDVTTGDGTNISVDSTRYVVDDIGNNANRHYDNTDDNETQFCERYFPKLKLVNTTDSFGVQTDYWFLGTSSTDVSRTAAKTIASAETAVVLATYTDKVGAVTQADLYNLTGVQGTINVFENGTANSTVTSAKGVTTKVFTAYVGATVKVVDNDANGVADAVIVEYPYLAKVTKVTAATATTDRFVTMEVYNDASMTAAAGVTYTTEDFAKGDYVLVYVEGAYATTEAYTHSTDPTLDSKIIKVTVADTLTGKVTKVTGTNGSAVTALTVDGTSYDVAADKFATQGLAAGTNLVKATTYDFTQEYTFLMNNGKILGVLGQANAAASSANYVYVVDATYTTKDAYGQDVYNVQVVNLDGTVETLPNKNTTNDVGGTALAAGFYVKGYDAATKTYTFTKATDSTSTRIDNTSVIYATNAVTTQTAMTASTKTLPITAVDTDGNTKAYVTEGTKILFVSGSKATLKVTTATGAIAQTVPASSKVLLSKDAQGNYIVDTLVITTAQVDVSGTVVYATSSATGVNANGNEYAIYSTTTGEKETVTASAAGGDTFATYTVNDKGVYTFADVSAAAVQNGNGVYTTAAALGAYGTAISAECGPYDIVDLEAADAVIINATGSPANNGLTLADLHTASALAAKILVKDNAVVAIAVTSYTAAV